jgi:signal transduction histidine kinase
VASTIRDISAHCRLEDDLRRQTRELEEANRQKDHFLAAFAHEFRSPLGVLANLAQLLRLPQVSAADQQRAVDGLGRQVTHMSRLVEDLLDVSLVRRGKIALRWEAVDLKTVISNAVELSQPLVEAREHRLEVAQCPEPLWVSGDASRLAQVVSNLLTNAAKYTPEGGHIRLSAAREDGAIAIHVRDNGVGIPTEMLSRVFDLFVQVESATASRAGGLGLGLTLVRQLVELHGGTVHVTSGGPGQGSEFVVRLASRSGAGPPKR